MEFIKKNRNMILAGLVLLAIVVAIVIVKETVMFDESEAIYGNRLEGIKKVKVTDDQIKQVKDALKDGTKSVDVSIKGRVINLVIETSGDISPADAKNLGNKALEIFTEEQKKYYDIEALIKNKDNKEQYPIIGYKHKTRENFTWTRDR